MSELEATWDDGLFNELKNWQQTLWINTFCNLFLPSILYWICRLILFFTSWNQDWATGVLLLYGCPVAAVAPTLALLQKGNFERTLSSMIISSILAPLSLPFLLYLWTGTSIDILHKMTLFLGQLIVIPLLLALFTICLAKPVQEKLRPHTEVFSILTLTGVVMGSVAGLTKEILENSTSVIQGIVIAFILMPIAYAIGWLCHPAETRLADRSTLAIVATWTNIGLSIVFAGTFFKESSIYVLLFVILSLVPWNIGFAPTQWFLRYQSHKAIL